MGDDGYVYLSHGTAVKNHYFAGYPLQSSVKDYVRGFDSYTPEKQWKLFRIANQAYGTVYPLFDLFVALILDLDLNEKWSFFVLETLILLLLSLGLAIFYQRFFSGPAWPALGTLALVQLPGQGLHYFIPGIACLALFLMALPSGRAITESKPFLKSAIFGFLICGLHLIGYAYTAVLANSPRPYMAPKRADNNHLLKGLLWTGHRHLDLSSLVRPLVMPLLFPCYFPLGQFGPFTDNLHAAWQAYRAFFVAWWLLSLLGFGIWTCIRAAEPGNRKI
ncbi:MAG: hypothetical protein R3B54_18485 [Bdellovibrionota bacterium]